MEQKIIYYTDELNDEFSEAKITPRVIDENYKYIHKNILWKISSGIVNFFLFFVKIICPKIKFQNKYIGKEKLKLYKNTGYFVYVNHTQPFADTFLPSNPIWPKKNFFIVNPENVSMKGLSTIVQMAGAIPVPANKKATKNFLNAIEKRISQNSAITIYPEAHIWPYYKKIRNFKSVSFKYPIEFNKPVFCMTNTYQKNSKGKPKIITYIDGPFFPDKNLSLQEQKQNLRDQVYNCMNERSKNSNIEYIKYVYKK
jgi:1-acyl-sn-glycerol-3-phosphate acyltransferase